MNELSSCPDRETLRQFLAGQLDAAAAEPLEAHVAGCARCADALTGLDERDPLVQGLAPSGWSLDATDEGVVGGLIPRLKALRGRGDTTLPSGTDANATRDFVDSAAAFADTSPDAASLLQPAAAPGEIGRLGPYRILGVLGQGGMGVVFEAEDPKLQRRVALKAMKPGMLGDAAHRERFLQEARSLAALEHDHIVPIHQVGEDRDVLFLAMPLLKGETLEARLQRDQERSWLEILRIGRHIALGLDAAHQRGLIHRDIKPSNVWLEELPGNDRTAPRYRVKILDFGLARAVSETPTARERITVAGTPAYMSPEQARSEPVDVRSDLFSLGCVLYRLCTGKTPFHASGKMALIMAVVTDDPKPVRACNPAVPPELADLVMQLLAKNREARPVSAAAVAQRLGRIQAKLEGRPLRRRLLLLAAAVLLLSLSWLAVAYGPAAFRFVANRGQVALDDAGTSVEVRIMQGENVVAVLVPTERGPLTLPAGDYRADIDRNPDGLTVEPAEISLERGGSVTVSIHRVPLTRGQVRLDSKEPGLQVTLQRSGKLVQQLKLPADPLDLPAGDYELVLVDQPKTLRAYPDRFTVTAGTKITLKVASVGELYRLDAVGAAVSALALDAKTQRVFAGAVDRGFGLWHVPSGNEIFYDRKQHRSAINAIALSADGRHMLTGSGEKGPKPDCTVRLWSVQPLTMLRQLDGAETPVLCVAFVAGDRQVMAGCKDGTLLLWDLDKNELTRTWPAHDGGVHALAVLPGAKQVLTAGGDGTLALWNMAGERLKLFKGHTDSVRAVVVSADGKVAVSASWDRTVCVWDVGTGQVQHKLTGHDGWVTAVALTPDGRRAVSGGQDKTVRVWDVATGVEILRLAGHDGTVRSLAIAPDGRYAVSAGQDRTLRWWQLP